MPRYSGQVSARLGGPRDGLQDGRTRFRLRERAGQGAGFEPVTLRDLGDERRDVLARRLERLRGEGQREATHDQGTGGPSANEREQVRRHPVWTRPCHVETSLRREWTDMRIPKPAMRVTIDVPP